MPELLPVMMMVLGEVKGYWMSASAGSVGMMELARKIAARDWADFETADRRDRGMLPLLLSLSLSFCVVEHSLITLLLIEYEKGGEV